MNKALIILAVSVLALWLLALPGGVGWYLSGWVPDRLAELGLEQGAEYRPGWFNSQLLIEDDWTLRLEARHLPGLNWLDVNGHLDHTWSSAAWQIDGQLGLTGQTRLSLTGADLQWDGQPALSSGPLALSLDQQGQAKGRLDVRLNNLDLSRRDAVLTAGLADLSLSWRAVDEQRLDLDLAFRLTGDRPVSLDLGVRSLDRDRLSELIEALQQLQGSAPDSAASRLAMIAAASAWQQLASAGLQFELERLALSEDNQLQGRWTVAQGPPHLSGSGHTELLIETLEPLVALALADPDIPARLQIQTWLGALRDQNWLEFHGERYRLDYPAGETGR